MAQRILLGFDALDKYSQDILAKHAKKRSLSYLQRIPSLRIPLTLDFESETDQDSERTNSGKPSSPRSSRYPVNTELGKKVHLRPFTASGYSISPDYEREERELKKLIKPRCASASRRRSWRSEVESIPDLDTLCHTGHTGPVLSSLGVTFIVSPGEMVQDSGTTVEHLEVPSYGDNTRPERTSLLPDTFGCSRAQDSTDHSPPSRENTQKAAAVSLCIEDEMKKSDIKILTVRQKTISGHVQNVSETHPIIYNNHIKNLSDLQRNLITRPCYFPSSQKTMGKPISPEGPLLQNNMDSATDFLRSKQLRLLKKSKSTNESSSDNNKVILHYLSADGTKQRVKIAKDGNVAKKKQVNSPGNRKNIVQDGKAIHISPANEKKDEERGVGPVINGINPLIAMDHELSLHGRSYYASSLLCPNSARTSSSPIPRPSSVREIHTRSYITISKPLSPPEGSSEPLQKRLSATASPDLMKGTMRPMSGARPMMFTAKSMILENRNGQPGSSPIEVNSIGTCLACKRSTEASQEEDKMEGGGTVESTSVSGQTPTSSATELLEMTSSKNESNEEQVQNNFSSPVHLNTIPVISIPTATIDSVE